MKKILAMILALAMILSMSAFAFAQENDVVTAAGEKTGEVKVNVSAETPVYYVVIEWGNLEFTYNKGDWKPETHTYDGLGFATAGSEKVTETSGTITVNNHSNNAVTYTAELTNQVSQADYGVKTALSGNYTAIVLPNAEGTTYANAPKNTFDVTVTVTDEEVLTTVVVATIKVTISTT